MIQEPENEAKARADLCAQYPIVLWTCLCGETVETANTVEHKRCNCHKWMTWSYPQLNSVELST